MSVAPGWYPDPDDANARRYWDGSTWSAPLRADVPTVPAQPKRRTPWAALIAGLVVVILVAGFCVYWFGLRSSLSQMTVRGTLDIEGSRYSGNYTVSAPDKIGDTSCEGAGGYSDLSRGVAVVVSDSGGKTVGTGSLEAGIYISGAGACILGFQVKVPSNLDTYGVTVSHRGTIEYSKAQMKQGPDLTIGS